MRARQLFSRLLTAVTLIVAAFVLLPSGAQAHAGHSHAVPSVRVTETNSAWQVVIAPIVIHAEVMTEQMGGKIALLGAKHGTKAPQSCPGGCCHSAGTGCCAAWLVTPLEMQFPLLGRLTPVSAVIGGSGIRPGALPEPPNALV
jgi:hypothetical protein